MSIPVKDFYGYKSVELWFVVGIGDLAFNTEGEAWGAACQAFPDEDTDRRYERIHCRTYIPDTQA